jgi:hypothetical protein
MKRPVTEPENLTEVETTDSMVVVVYGLPQGDRTTKPQSLYTIEYL